MLQFLKNKYVLSYKYYIYKHKFQKNKISKLKVETTASSLALFSVVIFNLASIFAFSMILLILLRDLGLFPIIPNFRMPIFVYYIPIFFIILILVFQYILDNKLSEIYDQIELSYMETENFRNGKKFIKKSSYGFILSFFILSVILIFHLIN